MFVFVFVFLSFKKLNTHILTILAAKLTNNQGKPITDAEGYSSTPFQLGAGHIQPSVAADPGLVYDASYEDYLVYLCSITGGNQLDGFFTCPNDVPPPSNLNYPSLAIAQVNGSVTVVRTVTNVGHENSSYSVTIDQPAGYKVDIVPTVLSFDAVGEKMSFKVTVEVEIGAQKNVYAFGSYVWSDGTHRVASPLVFSTS